MYIPLYHPPNLFSNFVFLNTVDSCNYVDGLLHYIGYYIGNSKHETIFYIFSVVKLSENHAEPRLIP